MSPTDGTWLSRLWWRLVKFGFRLLYNEMAWTYDLVSWVVSLGQWRNWQRTALKHLGVSPGASVLELAHGTGNLQLDLYAAGYRRTACDLSQAMGRIARRKLHRHRLEASCVHAYAQQLPFPNQIFDAIVSTFPTPFIIEPATLREAYRVLQPGKRLVIVTNAILTGGGVARDVLETAYRVTGQREDYPVDVSRCFMEAGFVVEWVKETCPYSEVFLIIATRN